MSLEHALKGHFLNLYHMALSDTEIDMKELETLYLIGSEKGISREEIDEMVIQKVNTPFHAPETVLEKIESLYDFARIAWADGKVDGNERQLLQTFALKFGFEDANIPTIIEFLLDEAQKGTHKSEIFKIVNDNL
jgi:hypothetical protein